MADQARQPIDAIPSVPPPLPSTVDLVGAEEVHELPTLAPGPVPTPIEQPLVPEADAPACPARAFGDYELLGEIARGGMGIVYRARERHSGRLVALKMMLSDSSPDPTYRRRFILEAQATGELSHPGIIAIHAWGEHAGQFFYTMDYVPGQPLSRILKRRPLPVPRAVRYLLGIARAVAAAHAQGIVHRDLKPSNIVIDPGDEPRVLDFGLAKRQRREIAPDEETPLAARADDDILDALPAESVTVPAPAPAVACEGSHATEKGAVLGTPSYMAPEQARGQHAKVGPPADVYALGAIFYEMLTGRPPFAARTPVDTVIQVIEQKPTPVRSLNRLVPPTLAHMCGRCLDKSPDRRYPDAGALADDLERRWHLATQRRRFAWLALSAGLAVVVLLACWLLLPVGKWLNLSSLTWLAISKAQIGGAMTQDAAGILAILFGTLIYIVPVLCVLALGVWSGAWIWYAAGGSGEPRREIGSAESSAEPYLQKLFAAGARPGSKVATHVSAHAAVELADVELGKTLQDTPTCLVRRARQKSLDRPVLVWIDRQPAASEAPAPGVMVHHPSVLSLHAVASGPEGRCLVTPTAAASPLAEILERRGLEPLEAAFLLVKVASALQAFHDQGACHGRLAPEWILVQGDLEPLLCPCGVPSQNAADRVQDVMALGRWLQTWLPPRPRRWLRQSLAPLYSVCDAACAGEYERPADLAEDLERAARAAFVLRRQRLASGVAALLFALPLLLLGLTWCLSRLAGSAETGPSPLEMARQFLASRLLLLLALSAGLVGFIHGRGLVHNYRLRLKATATRRFWQRRVLIGFGQVVTGALLAGLASSAVVVAKAQLDWRMPLLAVAELIGFWLLGVCASGLITFTELLVGSLKGQATGGLLDAVGMWGLPPHTFPSPQEAARTLGGRTRMRMP